MGVDYARGALAATTIGSCALFAGGSTSNGISGVTSVIYNSMYSTITSDLSVARFSLAATTIRGYALFGGGRNDYTDSSLSTVDAYSSSLTRTTPTALSVARSGLAATTVGNYALFGGGLDSDGYSSTVDAYHYTNTLQIYPGSTYKFNYAIEQTTTTFKEISVSPPINGYIKIQNTTIS